jgi:hypothetical protein
VVDVNNAQELIRSKLAGLLEDSHTQQQNNDNASAHDASETSAVAPVSPRALQSPLRHKKQYQILALIVHILLAAVAALGIPYGLWISAISASNQEAISGSIMILQPLLQVAVLHFAAHASWAFAKYVIFPCIFSTVFRFVFTGPAGTSSGPMPSSCTLRWRPGKRRRE